MSESSNARRAIRELGDGIKRVFKKYTKSARRASWKGLSTGEGAKLIDKLIVSPTKPLVGLERFVKFREWMEHNDFDL